ncbi:MAG TPA: transglutaminaseTgpA domain-containing protein [Dehalococcoidia bacterium]|nr:transglutaminaseTgpA domain-containing protein [Dehalococcoidia bacterium]
MTLNVGWDESLPESDPSTVTLDQRLGAFRFVRSGEAWLTFFVAIIAFGSVIGSIHSANWVSEMPSLVVAGGIGLVTGWLLGNLRGRALPLHLLGVGSGLFFAVALALRSMELEDELLRSGLRARFSEMGARIGEWLQAVVGGGISSDPLPFVLMLVFVVWLIGYLGTWAVFRWQNAWVALIPGGFALLTNVSYQPGQPSRDLVVYLFAAVLLIARLQFVRESKRWEAQGVRRAPYLSYEVMTFAMWVGLTLILFAWIVPTANNWGPIADRWSAAMSPVTERVDRVGRLFIGIGSKRQQHVHSFGSTLPLQGRVTLDDETVLMTVVAPDLPNDRPLYLRGAVYDEYSGQGWVVSQLATLPLPGTSVEAARFGTPGTRAQLRVPIEIEVTVEESVASRRLFSAGDPLTADVAAELLTDESGFDAIGLVPEERVESGDNYITVGSVSGAALDRLLTSGRNYPPAITDRYLQLPDDLPPEVAALAAEIVGGLDQPYTVARSVEAYLRTQYPFTLTIARRPPRTDSVAYFLFDSGVGYFDHHASAMSVLLRTLGVPARVAVGFALDPGDVNEQTKEYEVTEANAWTWPEVYFEGLGWVEFNPTPAERLISRPGDDSELFDAALNDAGRAQALDLLFDEILEIDVPDDSVLATPLVEESGRIAEIVAAVVTWGVSLTALLFAAGVSMRALWAYWFRGLGRAGGRWAKLQQLSSWAGQPMRLNRTPRESAVQLRAVAGIDDDVRPLARAYSEERYGNSADEADDDGEEAEALTDLYITVRNRLFRRVIMRWIRFGYVPSASGEVPAAGA